MQPDLDHLREKTRVVHGIVGVLKRQIQAPRESSDGFLVIGA